jgi:hypothetical protein
MRRRTDYGDPRTNGRCAIGGPDSSVTSVRATPLVQPTSERCAPTSLGTQAVHLWCIPHDLNRNVQHASRREFIIYANRHSRQDEVILAVMHRSPIRPLLPNPKRGCTLTTTLPAAPSVLSLIYPHVLWGKQMAIAAGPWYCAGVGCNPPASGAVGETDHFGFGCFKARPRYQLYLSRFEHLARSVRRALCFLAFGVGAM